MADLFLPAAAILLRTRGKFQRASQLGNAPVTRTTSKHSGRLKFGDGRRGAPFLPVVVVWNAPVDLMRSLGAALVSRQSIAKQHKE